MPRNDTATKPALMPIRPNPNAHGRFPIPLSRGPCDVARDVEEYVDECDLHTAEDVTTSAVSLLASALHELATAVQANTGVLERLVYETRAVRRATTEMKRGA